MRYFVLFEDDGDSLIKKIAGYHQFHGVREAVRVTTIASADSDDGVVRERRASYGDEVQPGSRKAGVFWHTQGSGKSISMCCYAGKLLQQPAMKNPTLVVVTEITHRRPRELSASIKQSLYGSMAEVRVIAGDLAPSQAFRAARNKTSGLCHGIP